MRKGKVIITLILLFVSVLSIRGQNYEAKVNRVKSLMDHCYKNRMFNGVALIARGDSVIFKNTYGYSVMEWKIPHTMDSKFRIASCTKQFIAVLALRLVEEGRLDLYKPISTWLPEWDNPIADSINIHQILSHTSGAPRWRTVSDKHPEHWYEDLSFKEVLDIFRDVKPEFKAGARFSYGSIGYRLLAGAIESATNVSLEENLNTMIFEPLGMKNSGLHNVYNLKENYAFAYENWEFKYNVSEHYNPAHALGSVGIYSTAPDLLKWNQAINNNVLLSDSLTRLMFTPVTFRHYEGYGYGWYLGFYDFLETGQKVNYQLHTGGMPGHASIIMRIPGEDYLIVLLNNTGHTKMELMAYEILRVLSGFEWTMPEDLAVKLDKCQTVEDVANLRDDFFKNEVAWLEAENHLAGLVYKKIKNKKTDLGKAILDFGIELYPNTTSILYNAAEGYYECGNFDEAFSLYTKLDSLMGQNSIIKSRIRLLKQ